MQQEIKDVFWQERELKEKFEQILNSSDNDSIARDDFSELLAAYQKNLNETVRLTRSSDRQQRKMRLLMEKLKRYVSPPLYKKIVSGKETVEINKTKRVRLSIFFSDIVNFSWHSRDMEGEALSSFLNSYLEEMTLIANKHGGTLDKYIGDAIMIFFGDPVFSTDEDHALRCVNMAIEMRSRLKELQERWFDLGYSHPLHVRMGISTGYVSVGNFGSSERLDYTIIGSPVNLAARIQSMAEEDQILISHATWALVKDAIPCSDAFSLELKGFDTDQLVHLVLSENQDSQLYIIDEPDLGLSLKWDSSKLQMAELLELINKLKA